MSRQHKKNIKLMIWWNIDDVQFLNREVFLWQEILPKGLNGLNVMAKRSVEADHIMLRTGEINDMFGMFLL